MKIYGNWKLFIIVLNVVIVLSLIGVLIYSLTINYELVDKDYYAKSTKFQQQINKVNRLNNLSERVTVNVGRGEIAVYFPKLFNYKKVEGKIDFYRPSASAKDFNVPILLDSIGVQKISFDGKEKGLWVMKIDWKENDSSYFYEEEILLK